MYAVFIGANGSMRLQKGKAYSIEVSIRPSGLVEVWWQDRFTKRQMYCPYSSKDKFLENWDVDPLKRSLETLIAVHGRDKVIDALHKMGVNV